MGEIRVIVDLPNENMRKALNLKPFYANYDSAKLKETMKRRLSEKFPHAKMIKVNVAPANGFFGTDVMGTSADEVLDMMKKVSDAISSIIREEKDNKTIK